MNEDFSLGKMNADARLTATFKYYEKTEQNGIRFRAKNRFYR